MSDVSQGPGWWMASDGRWYPPELHPDVRAGDGMAPAAGRSEGGSDAGGVDGPVAFSGRVQAPHNRRTALRWRWRRS